VVGSLVVSPSSRNELTGEHGLHDFAALIRGDIANTNDSAIGLGTRRANIDNLRLDSQNIARPNRIRPAQFIHPETDCAFGKIHCLNKEPHRNRGRMPTARDQSFEHRSLRYRPIEMKTLRIELTREFDDLLLGYCQRLGEKSIACVDVIKITLVHLERN